MLTFLLYHISLNQLCFEIFQLILGLYQVEFSVENDEDLKR